jgi:hypothetical protein
MTLAAPQQAKKTDGARIIYTSINLKPSFSVEWSAAWADVDRVESGLTPFPEVEASRTSFFIASSIAFASCQVCC